MHLRCEVIGANVLEELEAFHPEEDGIGVVSLMDHAPGHRQTSNPEYWKAYGRDVLGFSEEKIEADYVRLRHASRP